MRSPFFSILPCLGILLLLCFSSCVKEASDDLSPFLSPTLSEINAETSPKSIGVTFSCKLSDKNKVSSCGFRWGINQQNLTNELPSSPADEFKATLQTKEYGKTFYVQSHISNGNSELESTTISFKIPAFSYYVQLSDPTSMISSDGSSASVSSSLTVASGITISEKWLQYGESEDEMTRRVDCGAGNADIKDMTITGLAFNKTYFVCAFAKENAIQTESNIAKLKVPAFEEYVKLSDPEFKISSDDGSVKVSSTLSVAQGIFVTEKGIRYGESKDKLDKELKCGSGNDDIKDVTIPDLTLGKTYFVCTYARKNNDEAVSRMAECSPTAIPAIVTSEVTQISANSATCGG